jgi:hypothetical protein
MRIAQSEDNICDSQSVYIEECGADDGCGYSLVYCYLIDGLCARHMCTAFTLTW